MSIKPLQSINDLEAFLSEEYDPINLRITKVNKNLKARLVFKNTAVTMLFEFSKNVYKEVKEI